MLAACSGHIEDDGKSNEIMPIGGRARWGRGGHAGSSGRTGTGGSSGSGGSANGGSSNGGSTNGGSSNGGSTNGGSTNGGTGGDSGSASKGGSSGLGGSAGSSGTASTPPPVPADALPCFADTGKDAGSAISLELMPSRIEGVAPLLVFFDTDGTTADSTERPFEELAYCWSFGDDDAGTFATTGLPKNQAKGPIASHVFESPGTYTVTVSARDKDGLVKSRAVEVSVDDPESVFEGDSTVCFSPSGDFDGCPKGAKQVKQGSFSGLGNEVGTGKRLLMHRGETFASGGVKVNSPGPGMIGAYGEGEPPTVEASGTVITVSEQDEPNASDWRFADFNVVGTGDDSMILQMNGTAPDILMLRVGGDQIGQAAMAADTLIEYYQENGNTSQDNPDNFGFVDCNFQHLRGGSGHNFWYVAAHRFTVLGTLANDSTKGEHVLRIPWADRAVISDNDLGNAPSPRHVVKLHASQTSNGKESNHVVFSDNIIRSTGGNAWSVAIAPQDDQKDERIKHVLVERNLFLPGTAQEPLIVSAQDVVIRGNVVNRADGTICFEVNQRGIEPAPARITVENNTCYSTGSAQLLNINDATEVTVANNLVVGPKITKSSLPSGTGVTSNIALTDAGLAKSAPGDDWRDYMPTAGSPLIDAADDTAFCPWDYSGRSRPVDGDGDGKAQGDVGALEYSPK
jgi:hypothetical protein